MICLVAFLAADPLCAAATKGPAVVSTNFELIEKVSTEAAHDIISGIGTLPRDGLVLLTKAKGAGDADFILENALVKGLREAGIRVSVEAQKKEEGSSENPAYALSYQVVRLNLVYPRIARKWLFATKMVERSAKVDVVVRLVDLTTNGIIWVGESHKSYHDAIPYSLLASVEEKQYEFTRPPRNEFKLIRLLEPVVVGGIVIGLVYLFFSNQSNG